MTDKPIKEWTILIYGNGNNEMEPEIYNSLLDSEKVGSNDNINVIIEIGRADRHLVRIMRPLSSFPKPIDNWAGVRRYYVENPKSILIEDLGKINMADPITLYEFIKWGIENYKAKHYMLVLSGHGIAYIGGLTDLSFNVPYLMGIPEMAKAINLINKELNTKIDVLILDMCFMNSIEVIYELGKDENNTVKSIVTHIDEGPLEGLPYDKLIFLMQKYGKTHNLNMFLKYLIDNLSFTLTAIEINHKKLEKVKESFNDLAYYYLNNKDKNINKVDDLTKPINSNNPLFSYIKNINDNISSITIYTTKKFNGQNISIDSISEDKDKLISFYRKLAFVKNNYWICLQNDKISEKNLNCHNEIDLKPIALSQSVISSIISQLNPSISEENLSLASQRMSEYKKN